MADLNIKVNLMRRTPNGLREKGAFVGPSLNLGMFALVFLLTFFLGHRNAIADETNDIFAVITVDREEDIQGSKDDHYYWITYVYSNVASKEDDSFWKGVRSFFVEKDSEIVFQVQQEVLAGGKSIVKASSILSIFNRNKELVGNDVSYGTKLVPERRFQNSDSIKVRASLSEVTKERAAVLRLVLDNLQQIPLVSSFTNGTLTTASNILDTLTGLSAGPGEKRKIATYTIQGTDELAKTGYIAIVAKGDEAKFKALAANPASIPKTHNELNLVDASSLPSFVLLKIEADPSIYSPTQILSASSPVLPLIQNEIDAIKNAPNNTRKAEQCAELRSALNYLGPLSSTDEGYAAMAALQKAGYNPEASAAHQNVVGCVSYQEIDKARRAYPTFNFGSCISRSCRFANQFLNQWAKNKNTEASADTISWFTVIGGNIKEGSGDQATFRAENRLHRRWGKLRSVDPTTYSALGVMFGTNNDKPCTYEIIAQLGLAQSGADWKIESVQITETDELIDGSAPSSIYPGIPKCAADG